MKKNFLVGFLAIAVVTCLIFAVCGWSTYRENINWLRLNKHNEFAALRIYASIAYDEAELWINVNFVPEDWRKHNFLFPFIRDGAALRGYAILRKMGLKRLHALVCHPVSVAVESYTALLILTSALLIALVWAIRRKPEDLDLPKDPSAARRGFLFAGRTLARN